MVFTHDLLEMGLQSRRKGASTIINRFAQFALAMHSLMRYNDMNAGGAQWTAITNYLAWLSEFDDLSPDQRIANGFGCLAWSPVAGSRDRLREERIGTARKLSALCDAAGL